MFMVITEAGPRLYGRESTGPISALLGSPLVSKGSQ